MYTLRATLTCTIYMESIRFLLTEVSCTEVSVWHSIQVNIYLHVRQCNLIETMKHGAHDSQRQTR